MTRSFHSFIRSERRRIVAFINPPNYQTLEKEPSLEVANPYEHSDWSNYPSMGILVLASAVSERCKEVEVVYIDGNVIQFRDIVSFLIDNSSELLAVCVSCLTATYSPGLELLKICKDIDQRIWKIIGNDHFTALPINIMQNRGETIDFGFVGNEVVGSLCLLIQQLYDVGVPKHSAIPGLVYVEGGDVVIVEPKPEGIWNSVDYSIIDRHFLHSPAYKDAFCRTYSSKIKQWTGLDVDSGIALEFARGCVKFKNQNACSFCSISQFGMPINSIQDPQIVWGMMKKAYNHGYNYLYITADELPLTFNSLLKGMISAPPRWFSASKVALTGYCRADALSVYSNAVLLSDLGYKVMMVGIDAGPVISLKAVNKGFNEKSTDMLYLKNFQALEQARKVGIKIRIGFVVGHIGMTNELLKKSVAYFKELITSYADVICTADIEILSPEPGSRDFINLTEPDTAQGTADKFGLVINSLDIRRSIANEWKDRDIFETDRLVKAYVEAVMPELTIDDLIQARNKMRGFCKVNGINIGEEERHKDAATYYANA